MELEREINAQKAEIEAQKQILTDFSPMSKAATSIFCSTDAQLRGLTKVIGRMRPSRSKHLNERDVKGFLIEPRTNKAIEYEFPITISTRGNAVCHHH